MAPSVIPTFSNLNILELNKKTNVVLDTIKITGTESIVNLYDSKLC